MTNYVNEIWKQLSNYEGIYSVSNMGRLRRDKDSQNTPKGTITRGSNSKPYRKVSLLKDCIRITKNIHVLIAQEFISTRPDGLYINHKDSNKHNNCAPNLEYVTPKENILLSVIAGTHPRGSRIKQGKLKEHDIPIIIKRLQAGDSCNSISKTYGVSRQAISAIKIKKTWVYETLKLAGLNAEHVNSNETH